MGQANMNKKLFPIHIAFQKVPLITEICGGGFVHIVCAPSQLKPEQQNHYQKKEFLLVHSYHPFYLNLIFRFLGVKDEQDSMAVAWEHMRRGD